MHDCGISHDKFRRHAMGPYVSLYPVPNVAIWPPSTGKKAGCILHRSNHLGGGGGGGVVKHKKK